MLKTPFYKAFSYIFSASLATNVQKSATELITDRLVALYVVDNVVLFLPHMLPASDF